MSYGKTGLIAQSHNVLLRSSCKGYLNFLSILNTLAISISLYRVYSLSTAPVVIVEQPFPPDQPLMLMIGETATLTCAASSIPSTVITWFRVQNGAGPNLELVSGGDVIISSLEVNDTTVRSTLQLILANEEDFAGYFCLGDNGFISAESNTVQITLQS